MIPQLDPQQCLCFRIRRSTRHVTQLYDNALRPCDLRITQFTLLASVEQMGPSTLLTLAEMMGMDRTTLTRNLVPMQRSGLIEVTQGRRDRREREIRLTSAGRRTLRRAKPLWEGVQTEMMRRMGGETVLPDFAEVLTHLDVIGAAAQGERS